MPFMIGRAPIRRTIKYLEAGRLVLKDKIKIVTVNYNTHGKEHNGTKEFVFWYLPQIQYKNRDVQITTLKNMTPTPFIRCFYDTGEQMLIDTFDRTKEDIYEHLINIVGKPKDVLAAESMVKEKEDNPANFGKGYDKHCICEIPGQVPCPGTCPLPKHWRGKYKYNKIVE
ncbi:probable 28S ribosomal protein S25, mitochondrial [Diorhabda sublineata]|uniref:probable 28S ribosomal protein S25, mitochondrial n=1 Tax=Diorhabda sublineata TaxID=1163346 RepID=UPI0024E0BF41|nr:probable 28S ribosomal protein S25, mitochondrial [Diorhabda sublineata]